MCIKTAASSASGRSRAPGCCATTHVAFGLLQDEKEGKQSRAPLNGLNGTLEMDTLAFDMAAELSFIRVFLFPDFESACYTTLVWLQTRMYPLLPGVRFFGSHVG